MILYPAIDLKDGQAVRLVRGAMDQATVFNDDPAAQAKSFVEAGCEWLHLVDLNGAFAGEPVNAAPVEAILKACKVPAQLGGGIRDMATIERWIDKGLARVILGTVAVENPDLVRAGDRVISSGDGGVFPAGLLIGQVANDPAGRLRVRLSADYERLEYLRVLRHLKVEPVTGAGTIVAPVNAQGQAPAPQTEEGAGDG